MHNMHIGIVSSSLGPRLGNQCPPDAMQATPAGRPIPRHNDDQAPPAQPHGRPEQPHELHRGGPRRRALARQLPRLVPAGEHQPVERGHQVHGPDARLHRSGRRLRPQQRLPAARRRRPPVRVRRRVAARVLVPLPHPARPLRVAQDGRRRARARSRSGWASTRRSSQQRADFLRPDSLVAILVLTDENDSEVDVRSFGGTAWNFMTSPGFNPPRGTSVCLTNPADPGCTSCAFGKNGSDPQCMMNNGTYTDAARLGVRPQPAARAREAEVRRLGAVPHPAVRARVDLARGSRTATAEYPMGATSYQGLNKSNLDVRQPALRGEAPVARAASRTGTPRRATSAT